MKSFLEWFKENHLERRMMNYDTLKFGYIGAYSQALDMEVSFKDDIEAILNEEIHFNGYSLTVGELIDGKK